MDNQEKQTLSALLLTEYFDGGIGLGMRITVGEKEVKCGVRLPPSPTLEDIKKAWGMLARALKDPLNPKNKPAIGENCLSYNEMSVSTNNEWISVDDRLPDKPMTCIVWHSVGRYFEMCPWVVAANGEQQFFDTEDGYICEDDITHWIPLTPPICI